MTIFERENIVIFLRQLIKISWYGDSIWCYVQNLDVTVYKKRKKKITDMKSVFNQDYVLFRAAARV